MACVFLHTSLDWEPFWREYWIAYLLALALEDFRRGRPGTAQEALENEYRAILWTIAWGYGEEALRGLHYLRQQLEGNRWATSEGWAYCLQHYSELEQAARAML